MMANRRTKATEVEKFYIEHNPDSLSQEALSNKFELTLKTVAKIQQEFAANQPEPEPVVEEVEHSITRDLMTFKPDKSKPAKITIMTEAASQRAEANAQATRDALKGKKYKNGHTAKTYPNEK